MSSQNLTGRSRPAWDASANNKASEYALSKEEQIRRKTLFVSKHANVSSNSARRAPKKRTVGSTRTYSVVKNKILFEPPATEDSGDDLDETLDVEAADSVLDLLHTPTKHGNGRGIVNSNRPPMLPAASTPLSADRTHDMMATPSPAAVEEAEVSTVRPMASLGEDDENETEKVGDGLNGDEEDESEWVSVAASAHDGSRRDASSSAHYRPYMRKSAAAFPTTLSSSRLVAPTTRGTPRFMPPSSNKRRVVPRKAGAGRSGRSALNESTVSNISNQTHHASFSSTNPSTAQFQAQRDEAAAREAEDAELRGLSEEIGALASELQYFEQLTGRRSALGDVDSAELSAIATGRTQHTKQSMLAVMRALTRLVCQTMTYLLKGEVDAQAARGREDALVARVDTLTALIMPHSANILGGNSPLGSNESEGVVGSGVSAQVLDAAARLPEGRPMASVPTTGKGHATVATRMPDRMLDSVVADMRDASLEVCTAKPAYDPRRYGARKDDQGATSLNISLAEGSVTASAAAPFSANLSPVRGDRTVARHVSTLESEHMSGCDAPLIAHFNGSSATDLLFGAGFEAGNDANVANGSSLTEAVGPALHRATNSANQIGHMLGTPVRRGAPDLARLPTADNEHADIDSKAAYEAYLAAQQRMSALEASMDDSALLDSSDEDQDHYQDEHEDEDEHETPPPPPAANLVNKAEGKENDDWAHRMGAMQALSAGVSELSAAVRTVRPALATHVPGPFSRANRDEENDKENDKENKPPSTPTGVSQGVNEESSTIVVPSVGAPKPFAAFETKPLHPFANRTREPSPQVQSRTQAQRYKPTGLTATPTRQQKHSRENEQDETNRFSARGRLRERTFNF